MTLVNLSTILAGVKAELEGVTGVIDVQGHDELTENIADHPLIQVWPGGGGMGDPAKPTSTQTSFRGALRQIEQTVYADLYVTQRTFLGQDMGKLVTYIDRVIAILDDQTSPAFNVAHCRLERWNWTYFSEEYATEMQVGARFELILLIY